jgi:signal transduction histidine kinase
MKPNRSILISLILLIVVAALYRIIPNRPLGFMPHIAMAIFGGAMIRDKKWAFALPIFSMFISDLMYEVLFRTGHGTIPGFYAGQITNYILFAGLTLVGFLIRSKVNFLRILAASLAAPTLYFLVSNFFVWSAGGGYARPKTFSGLIQCYSDALPFFRGNLISTVIFGALLFGGYFILAGQKKVQLAGE